MTTFRENVPSREPSESDSFVHRLLEAIRQASKLDPASTDSTTVFEALLGSLVALSDSKFGVLEEVLPGDQGEGRTQLVASFGMASSGETPAPDLKFGLELPLCFGGREVGTAKLGNHTGGFAHDLAENLAPFLSICAAIVDGHRQGQLKEYYSRQLEECRQMLEAVLGAAPEASFLLDAKGRIVQGNAAFAQRIGIPGSELVGRNIMEFLPPEVSLHRRQMVEQAFRTCQPMVFEDTDGVRTFRLHLFPMLNSNGRAERIAIFGADITEQRQATDHMKALAEVVDAAPSAITVHDVNGNFLYTNKRNCLLHQYTTEEYLRLNLRELDTPESLEKLEGRIQVIREMGEATFEVGHYRKDGSVLPLEVSVKPIQWRGQKALLSIGRDITEQKRAERLLLESETRVRARLETILKPDQEIGQLALANLLDVGAIQGIMDDLASLTHLSVALVDLDGKVLVNAGWQDICTQFHRKHHVSCMNCNESDTFLSLGVRPNEFKAYKCKNNMWDVSTPIVVGNQHVGNLFVGQFFYEEETIDIERFRGQAREFGFDEDEYLAALHRVPRWNRSMVEAMMRFYAKLGALISNLSYSNIILARNVEERKRSEAEVNRANTFLDSIIENIPLMVFIKEANALRFVRVNRAGERTLGHSRESLLGKSDYDFFPEAQARFFVEKDRLVLSQKELVDIPEEPLDAGDNKTRILHTLKVPILNIHGEPEYLLGISEDITERKQTEEALRQSEALHKALAQENAALLEQARRDADSKAILLNEVNHRVKNNLTAIVGLLRAQQRFIREDLRSDFQEAMKDLASRIETLAMAHSMLSLAKWEPLPLKPLFGELMQTASRLVPHGKRLAYRFTGEDVKIPAKSVNSLALVLFELATNTIKHGFCQNDFIQVGLETIWKEEGLEMRYRDSGPGYPDSVLQAGKSNLGLYLVRLLASHDLRGVVTLCNDSGAVVEVRFGSDSGIQRLKPVGEEAHE